MNRELFMAQWELQVNHCRMADVRDAMRDLEEERMELWREQEEIIGRIAVLEQQHGED